jgi:hypothetical protein
MMVALLILAIVMSASLYSILQGLTLSRDSQDRVVAASVVSKVLEGLHTDSLSSTGFNSIPIGKVSLASQTVQGTKFTLTQDTEWVSRGTNTAACNASTNQGLVLRATVGATWGVNSVEAVNESTLLSPPNGTFTSTDGTLGVTVLSASGAGYSGATVSVTAESGQTGSSPSPQVTGTDGCVFFTNLLPVSYSVSVNSSTGIDSYEESTYATNNTSNYYQISPNYITVSATQPATTQIQYDNYGTVFWSYGPEYSNYSLTTYPPGSNMPISLDDSSLSWEYNMVSFPNPPTGTTVSGSVDAYPTSYGSIFSGGCTDADPNGVQPGTPPTSFYTGTTVQSPVTLSASGSTTDTVPLYPVALTIESATGTPLPTAVSPTGTTPTAVEGQTAGTTATGVQCPDAQTVSLSPVAAGVSDTSVGLGHYYISVTVNVPGVGNESGTASIWVEPAYTGHSGGVYLWNSSTSTWSQVETFSSSGPLSGSVPVKV